MLYCHDDISMLTLRWFVLPMPVLQYGLPTSCVFLLASPEHVGVTSWSRHHCQVMVRSPQLGFGKSCVVVGVASRVVPLAARWPSSDQPRNPRMGSRTIQRRSCVGGGAGPSVRAVPRSCPCRRRHAVCAPPCVGCAASAGAGAAAEACSLAAPHIRSCKWCMLCCAAR